ncbi:unnamed protein product [Clonostachys rhizophaga]|uniref:Xylanolytic transcriptional activator regulatory domain-containing protein n=1 Tax=Clonostachys rhizophaga TaxID=160324 RepID=A0A9N9YJQ1_9HYPO|nr:unnamed protein product [Clonostachys rhizophaga]
MRFGFITDVPTKYYYSFINPDAISQQCDGQSPQCRNCVKAGRDCLVEDPGTGLQRPRDHIRTLEARIAYLETLVQDQTPEAANRHVFSTSGPREGQAGPYAYHRADAGSDTLSSEVAVLCLSAAGREPHYFGPSSAVSFSRIASAVMGLPNKKSMRATSDHGGSDKAREGRRRTVPVIDFPSASRMEKLSEAYFANIHPQYPFLHRPTARMMEKECMEASQTGDVSTARDTSLFFVLMIYAIGSLTLGRDEVDAAEGYYAMALDRIGQLLELNNLQSIQALLCCAVYSIRSPVGVSLWKISSMAIRHCVELGYHRSSERFYSSANTLTKEMSRRCFWVSYDIDRVASFILGLPVGIADTAIDAELPSDINDEDITINGFQCPPRTDPTEPATTMTSMLHATKLRQIWSKFSDNIYFNSVHSAQTLGMVHGTSVESLRQELEQWYAMTPVQHPSRPSQPLSVFVSKDWFQLAYDYSILLLYRHCITSSGNTLGDYQPMASESVSGARDRAFEICAEKARDICLIYRRVYQINGSAVQFTWGSLHILFLGGLTYLYCLWRSPYVRQQMRPINVMNTCMACTTVLIIIAERWPQTAAYRDIWESLSERTIKMICDGTEKDVPNVGLSAGFDGSLDPSKNSDMGSLDPADASWTTLQGLDTFVPLEDWIINLEYTAIPGDPQWLAQELLQGLRGQDPMLGPLQE